MWQAISICSRVVKPLSAIVICGQEMTKRNAACTGVSPSPARKSQLVRVAGNQPTGERIHRHHAVSGRVGRFHAIPAIGEIKHVDAHQHPLDFPFAQYLLNFRPGLMAKT